MQVDKRKLLDKERDIKETFEDDQTVSGLHGVNLTGIILSKIAILP